MIKSCVIGLSKIGQIHCNNLKKLKKTSLNFVYDKNLTLRKNTERPITITEGTNELVCIEDLEEKIKMIKSKETNIKLWNGKSSYRLLPFISKIFI